MIVASLLRAHYQLLPMAAVNSLKAYDISRRYIPSVPPFYRGETETQEDEAANARSHSPSKQSQNSNPLFLNTPSSFNRTEMSFHWCLAHSRCLIYRK